MHTAGWCEACRGICARQGGTTLSQDKQGTRRGVWDKVPRREKGQGPSALSHDNAKLALP